MPTRYAEAAREALRILERPATIPEIWRVIEEDIWLGHKSAHPEQTLRNEIRKNCEGVAHIQPGNAYLIFTNPSSGIYGLVEWQAKDIDPTQVPKAEGEASIISTREVCLCCEKGLSKDGKRMCPLCDHVFRGHGWDGIDAHWKSKHLDVMPYETFWASLCAGHGGNVIGGHKTLYRQYMDAAKVDGSNKASSYIRAIELLDPILAAKGGPFADCHDIYAINSVRRVSELYEFVLEQQRLGEKGMFAGEEPVSYWRDRHCSAALKSYREFLVMQPYKQKLWEVYERGKDAAVVGRELDAVEGADLKELVEEKEIDFGTKEGMERVATVKARVNQDFFREMILHEYGAQCCLSGLNLPGVLRASHIVGWAEDKKNRLNPANGLCLSATYDAAFDRHLISFDEDCRMILSSELKEYYTNDAFKTEFLNRQGQAISRPRRFLPSQDLLARHREKLK